MHDCIAGRMGLAELVKRRLGGSQPQRIDPKRPRTGNDAAPGPAALTLAELAARNTRTARRKLKQAKRIAHQHGASERKPTGHAGERLRGAPPAEESQSEDDADGVPKGLNPSSSAYEALLASLKDSSDAFADAYEQRQRELAGDSGESEEEEEKEDGAVSAEEEVSGDDDEVAEHSAAAEGTGEDSSREDGNASDGAGEESQHHNGARGDAAGGGSAGKAPPPSGHDPDADIGEYAAAPSIAILAAQPARKPSGKAAEMRPPEDHFDAHLEAELSEAQVAALSTCGAAYVYAPTHLQRWLPAAKVQATAGARLPTASPAELAGYGVRERLIVRWREVNAADAAAAAGADAASDDAAWGCGAAREEEGGDFVSSQQRALFSCLNSYCDVLHPCRPYPTSTDAADPEMDAVLLHVLNHCARAADRIKRNNERLAAAARGAPSTVDPPRDQGFTRPKVLLLLPMRNAALRVILRLLALAVKETRTDTVQHKKRFLEEFGGEEEAEEEASLGARARAALARKPREHRALFAGSTDDHFRLGIKITRGAVRLYTDFYQSDILVASPLALATRLEEGRREEGEGVADFLSSIEVVVVERADVMQMQNWAHVGTVMEALNRVPHQQRGVDIMRVRPWALAGQARHYCQTVVLSGHSAPEVNALIARGCANHAGAVRLVAEYEGVLSRVVPQVRQIFERLPTGAGGAAAAADARFDHFTIKVWPRIREGARGQLVYIPSYFDYVRVRNFLRAQAASFLGLCEYSERADMARARAYFADGRRRVLLYTERAQFYNRHRIRGVQDVLFYQLPEHAAFYPEVVNWLLEESALGAELATATVLYGRYDALRLERVVGSARSGKMLKKGAGGTFLFC